MSVYACLCIPLKKINKDLMFKKFLIQDEDKRHFIVLTIISNKKIR